MKEEEAETKIERPIPENDIFLNEQIVMQPDMAELDDEWSLVTFQLAPTWLRYLTIHKQLLKPFLHIKPSLGHIMSDGHEAHAKRDVLFMSDVVSGYQLSKLSKLESPAKNFDKFPFLRFLLQKVNERLGEHYNGIIVNSYEDGRKSIGAHRDNPKGNGRHGVVTISVGATRVYRVSKITDNQDKSVFDLVMKHGDVVWMKDKFQEHFKHAVPPDPNVTQWRMSFTFRHVVK